MNKHDDLIDMSVLRQLARDIGPANATQFLDYLDQEFELRTGTLGNAFATNDLQRLAAESHAFKSCALTYGAPLLAARLQDVETLAKAGDAAALAQAGDLLAMMARTRQAYRDLHLSA